MKNEQLLSDKMVAQAQLCDFCAEFHGNPENRFHKIYGPSVSRILLRKAGFIVLPTIGQIFEGSLLILPERHIERIASLNQGQLADCMHVLDHAVTEVSKYGVPIVFEHGATSCSQGGCGIYHAHIHVVPLPSGTKATCEDLMPHSPYEVFPAIHEAYRGLTNINEYLLLRDTTGTVATLCVSPEIKHLVPSQVFRQRLQENFGLKQPWDWRAYSQEQSLLQVVNNRPMTYASI